MLVDKKYLSQKRATGLGSKYHNYLERKGYVINRPTSKYFLSTDNFIYNAV